MYTIEQLPVATTHKPSHGWAYVPDIKPQRQPLESRKRGARNKAAGGADLSAKQQKAIQIKLKELDKENHKDTQVPIPTKNKARSGKKITPNVRRILTYQRTFVHYLADEEAQITQAGGGGASNGTSTPSTTTVLGPPQTPASGSTKSSRNSLSKQSPMQPPARPSSAKRRSSTAIAATPPASTTITTKTTTKTPSTTEALSQLMELDPAPPSPTVPPTNGPHQSHLIDDDDGDDNDDDDEKNPLLRTKPHIKPPSSRLLAHLLSEPALSYSASRAQPLEDHEPTRHFCTMCGYWGKVRCKRCGERTCGLMECWRSHDGICAVPAY